MEIRKLDHIALYMRRRDTAATFLTSHLGFHIVDHTDRYTLVGAGGRLGKLTLFDAPEGTSPAPGAIERINVRVADPESAADRLSPELAVEQRDGGYIFSGPEGLRFALVSGEGNFTDYDLEGLILRSEAPEESARHFVSMGFAPGEDATTGDQATSAHARNHRVHAHRSRFRTPAYVGGPVAFGQNVRS